MLLYIIRHGQPIYGEQERLTDLGHLQAKAISQRLKDSGITKIYSSPMRRAQQTAAPTAEALGLPVQIEDWMHEYVTYDRFKILCDDGQYRWPWNCPETAPFVMGGNRYLQGDAIFDMEPMKNMANGKEGYRALAAESDEFLSRHGYVREGSVYRAVAHNEDRIAIFCHIGFSLSWLSYMLGIPPHLFWMGFEMSHSGITIVNFQPRPSGYVLPRVMCLSDLTHLAICEDTDYLYNSKMPI